MERNGRNEIRIIFIGSGNVATHLATALDKSCSVISVFSRNLNNASHLAAKLFHAEATDNILTIDTSADFYILAVSDDALYKVIRDFPPVQGIVAHTSGSVGMDVFQANPELKNFGIFYPLQTFSKTTTPDLSSVPFFIEGNSAETTNRLTRLAEFISPKVVVTDSETRRHLHIAAVFANNFANYAWVLAQRYLTEHTCLDFNIFEPLLRETLNKAFTIGPIEAQTGPAKRNDTQTVLTHLGMLNPDMAEIYRLLSQHITTDYNTPPS